MLKVIDEAVDGMILTSNKETTQEKIINVNVKNFCRFLTKKYVGF